MIWDLINIGFRNRDSSEILAVNDETKGFRELHTEMERAFGIREDDWFSAVAFPAFSTNWTTLWGDPSDPDRVRLIRVHQYAEE